ncbi:Fic family protein [Oscillospiraceae bacterium 50-60]
MAYSIDSTTDGCYPGTTCLVNKLGIQDELALAETEAAVVLGKASLLDQQPIPGVFDFDHYKRIHQFLFCDLYDWAGQIRTINLSKKGTAFVPAAEIESCAVACFKRLAEFSGEGMSHRELAEEVADFYHTVNMLHPFREGNGRTQRIFFTQWIRSLGYDFDLSSVDPDAFMIATIYAAQGVMDQLADFFEQMIEQPQMEMRTT